MIIVMLMVGYCIRNNKLKDRTLLLVYSTYQWLKMFTSKRYLPSINESTLTLTKRNIQTKNIINNTRDIIIYINKCGECTDSHGLNNFLPLNQ